MSSHDADGTNALLRDVLLGTIQQMERYHSDLDKAVALLRRYRSSQGQTLVSAVAQQDLYTDTMLFLDEYAERTGE